MTKQVTFAIGDRVVVGPLNANVWAVGITPYLNGKLGTVEREKLDLLTRNPRYLVTFDETIEFHGTSRTPATGHWFDSDEIHPA